jgi:hypothetical protein
MRKTGTNYFFPDETAGNSHKIPVLEWDNFIPWPNPYDLSYELAMAGGVTTAHILPSSTNNIGTHHVVLTCLFVNTIGLVQAVKL